MIRLPNKEYHFFNLLIFVAILFLVVYLKTEIISLKCAYAEIGMKCKTCGLTSSFKKIINNDFSNVNFEYLLLFIAFISQLFIRPLISVALIVSSNFKLIRNIDITFSVILFGYTYFLLMVK